MSEKEIVVASDILRKHIKPEEHVLAIGPNFSPMLDPSSFFLSTHLLHKRGKLTLLDNKSTALLDLTVKKMAQLERAGNRPSKKVVELHRKLAVGDHDRFDNIAGVGDPHAYGEYMRSFRRAGFSIKLPRIVISDARRIQLPDNSVDVVFEHGTLPWLENTPRALAEYLRVVRPGGKVIIFTNDHYPKFHDELKRLLTGEKKPSVDRPAHSRLIASVTEHAFLPAYSALSFVRSVDPEHVKLDRLDPNALSFFNAVGRNKFWMTSLQNVFNCSRGFVIEKSK
ncbi:MAG: class I SAM-dependent methyltransferase [Candidatus Micrarchaeota archaeon]